MPDRMEPLPGERPTTVHPRSTMTAPTGPMAVLPGGALVQLSTLQRAVGNDTTRVVLDRVRPDVVQRQPTRRATARAKPHDPDQATVDYNADQLSATHLDRLGYFYGLKRPQDRFALVRAIRSGWSRLTNEPAPTNAKGQIRPQIIEWAFGQQLTRDPFKAVLLLCDYEGLNPRVGWLTPENSPGGEPPLCVAGAAWVAPACERGDPDAPSGDFRVRICRYPGSDPLRHADYVRFRQALLTALRHPDRPGCGTAEAQ